MSSDEFGKLQGPSQTFEPKGIRCLFGIKRYSTQSLVPSSIGHYHIICISLMDRLP